MDMCLIFGSFGYLGFELTKQLLDKGMPVIHVDISDDAEPDDYVEEKHLWVGRNGNFTIAEKDEEIDWSRIQAVIIPLYDWQYFFEEDKQKVIDRLKKAIVHFPDRPLKIVIIESVDHPLQGNFLITKKEKWSFINVAIPALYGGWQPKQSYFFQLWQKKKIVENGIPLDTINVYDVAEGLIRIMELEKEGSFIMKNADANRLRECITYLTEDDPIAIAKERYDLLKSDETRGVIPIKETVDFRKVLQELEVINTLHEK